MSKKSAPRIWIPALWIAAITLTAAGAIAASGHFRAAHARAQVALSQKPVSSAAQGRVRANLAALPLAFEPNQGQTDPQVKYMARGNGYKLFLTSSKAIMKLSGSKRHSEVRDMMMDKRRGPAAVRAKLRKQAGSHHEESPAAVLQMNFLGANPNSGLVAEDLQTGKINYLLGKDRSNWHSNIPLYGRVNYQNVYPGINLSFHGASTQLEFDYLVSPGADPKNIGLSFEGAQDMRTNEAGDLILATNAGPLHLHKPVAYQLKKGQRELVDARFVLKNTHQVSFQLGAYDRNRELVIDPTVNYATYFGGSNADYGVSAAIDASGNLFVAGATDSASIPGVSNTGTGSFFDAYVTELDSTGGLVKTTIFGGSKDEFPGGIAIDSTGIYVAGTTDSNDFPVTTGAAQTTALGGSTNGANDAFALKLDPTLTTLDWATYIAGSDSDSAQGVAVDTVTHVVYVAGETYSNDLGGATGGINPLPNGNAVNRGAGPGIGDGFIAQISATGTAFGLISYIGGTSADLATGVAVNQSTGDIFVSGETISSDLPTTTGVVQPHCGTDGTCNNSGGNVSDDVFAVSIKADLSGYNYVTYYGGGKVDDAFDITADGSGHAFITGTTSSTDFPTAASPYQSSLLGTQNAFITELNSTGSAAVYSTYFGGDGVDLADSIALDNLGNIYLTGQTSSGNAFPLINPTQTGGSGSTDAFVSVFSISQGQPLFSTFLGGSGDENGYQSGIAVDNARNIYVTGDTDSSDFPVQAPIDGTYGGGTCTDNIGNSVPCPDAFIVGYTRATDPDFYLSASPLNPASVAAGGSATSTITVTSLNNYAGTVNLACAVTSSNGASPLPSCSMSGGTLTVTTTGKAAALYRSSGTFYAMWLPVLGLSLVGMGMTGAESRRKKMLGLFLLGLMMSALFFLPACSSSSTTVGGGGCSGCTPPGSYTISVTGTDSANTNLKHDLVPPLTLTVQ